MRGDEDSPAPSTTGGFAGGFLMVKRGFQKQPVGGSRLRFCLSLV